MCAKSKGVEMGQKGLEKACNRLKINRLYFEVPLRPLGIVFAIS
jgi:hypothetical protein